MPVLSARRRELADHAGSGRQSRPSPAAGSGPYFSAASASLTRAAHLSGRGTYVRRDTAGGGPHRAGPLGPPETSLRGCSAHRSGERWCPGAFESGARAARPPSRVGPGKAAAASRGGAGPPRAEVGAGSGRGARSGEWGLAAAGAWETVSVGWGPRRQQRRRRLGVSRRGGRAGAIRLGLLPFFLLFGPLRSAAPTSHP
ncbi:Dual specificity protein kinase clk3 [Saguinus oedipus]|uniref:Dual specificity protein kinase clk3 n=1 Tax=Saguinus oedipus TaxID=9490 RepID=A0ABQ9V271_SAGOE|nr:Dual specificity protein kinase clk3 [Saguinus oedipus]